MKFKCIKVRPTTGAYTDTDMQSTPARCFEIHMQPMESQHLINGVVELRFWLWRECPYEQGQEYEIQLSIEA